LPVFDIHPAREFYERWTAVDYEKTTTFSRGLPIACSDSMPNRVEIGKRLARARVAEVGDALLRVLKGR
jgi:hypothetical protein